MASLFTKIIEGKIPCHKIFEDDNYLAFLDIRPINPGHTLVIPKKEVDYIFDVEDKLLGGLMIFAKKVAIAIKKEMPCKKVGIMVAGLEVPHTHIHLVPMFKILDLNFANATPTDNEELAKIAERIRKHL
ncbi:MAG: HIT family hydrolase [Omnitrophica WOR_2 bacterium GWF2_38_59]|nr:MAG: HIT family hydrolase [Omnitrophica WOR_2 bacterium GWA2_37_7]OGX25570.1 MAG: HIT family hydrolase [Omnitrophica WOR_2 bacterium GWF2_38_59]OGX50189.1 MAG: HIT family hydrolase [Omnitrophica WOR_2 bacterium RIFOXYA2_FULL_38_17]OGX52815.1 MAG: HIT family hydrolase [Omnitrophica WOR_2 bacterium RIFOXYA12_FULL_38_10]OGX57443.1 MAG: HIT family hydrolase [Omnitrophica WOR_2 bacterium RIFOXYB2_FULL_38_16]OGX57501.1 MAG: HIT family hydrolase [Omnitrophica WOR_2 bacterium RIFOXYC2_FULL_38_12]H